VDKIGLIIGSVLEGYLIYMLLSLAFDDFAKHFLEICFLLIAIIGSGYLVIKFLK
jgi:hypothetical protein